MKNEREEEESSGVSWCFYVNLATLPRTFVNPHQENMQYKSIKDVISKPGYGRLEYNMRKYVCDMSGYNMTVFYGMI